MSDYLATRIDSGAGGSFARLMRSVSYTPSGAVAVSVSAVFAEQDRRTNDDDGYAQAEEVARLVLDLSTVGVSAATVDGDTVEVDGDTWLVRRVIAQRGNFVTLELRRTVLDDVYSTEARL